MVSVHVADEDRRQRPRIHQAFEPAGDTLADVEEDRGLRPFHEVARGGRIGVGDRIAASEHGESEAAGQDDAHRVDGIGWSKAPMGRR